MSIYYVNQRKCIRTLQSKNPFGNVYWISNETVFRPSMKEDMIRQKPIEKGEGDSQFSVHFLYIPHFLYLSHACM